MKHFIFILLICSVLYAKTNKTYDNVVVQDITSIYDGDTFRCNIKGYPAIIGEHIGIRVYGVDCPEMRDNREKIKALARQAKQYTVKRLREGKVIKLVNMQRGKYFRIVAEVYIDGSNLGNELIKKGLAKPYFGGKKTKW